MALTRQQSLKGSVLSLFLLFAIQPVTAQNTQAPPSASRDAGPTFSVPDADLPKSLSLIVYGDMRFTDPANTKVANPQARRLLVGKVASERPDALILTGDVPYAGGQVADYEEFRSETTAWKAENLRLYPVLGNHELVGDAATCLGNWWSAFPQLTNRRWYSVQFGSRIYLINLDSNSDLREQSPQMIWLQAQIAHLAKSVDFVFVAMHHPAVADKQTLTEVDHNPRPNEIALRDYISHAARRAHAQFIVFAGHIHNYERLLVSGVTYLFSGGGGARPYEVERGPGDLYQTSDSINFHYILFHLDGKDLQATMYRLTDPAAQTPEWQPRDTFIIHAH
jgi:acid phosphatase type 7